MLYVEHTVTTSDNTRLFVRTLTPPDHLRCGRTVVIIHGTSEHGGRYEHVGRVAAESGWDVIIPDARGHGRSEGVPVHVTRFERYLQDLDTHWGYFELHPDRTAVVGHSFGGLISARFAQTRPTRLAALVLLSPLLGLNVEIDLITLLLGRLMSVVAPRTRFQSRVPASHTTRNEEVLKHREADPLLHRSVTAAWFFQMKRALRDVHRDAAKLHVPVLALQAGQDYIVDPRMVEPWLATVGSDDRAFEMFPDHYHELLNEPDWATTLGRLLSWLENRVPCLNRSRRTPYPPQ